MAGIIFFFIIVFLGMYALNADDFPTFFKRVVIGGIFLLIVLAMFKY